MRHSVDVIMVNRRERNNFFFDLSSSPRPSEQWAGASGRKRASHTHTHTNECHFEPSKRCWEEWAIEWQSENYNIDVFKEV